MLARGSFRGKSLLDALIDLPFAVSPIVIGLALVLVYGRNGWVDLPFQVIFSVPGIVLATIFVSLPFVVREVTPVLREVGDEQEQAAATLGASGWQTFWRITLPSIRWGVTYGVVLSVARCIGEFGAVSVVSGHIAGQTDDADAARRAALPELRRRRRVRRVGAAGRHRAGHAAPHDPREAPEVLRMIAAHDVVKRFGDFVALDDVSIDVASRAR